MDRRNAIKRTAVLTGAGLSASIIAGLSLPSCQPTGSIDWEPSFLTNDEALLVSKISDLMLPASDGPGALDVHVPEFVDLMVRDCLTTEEQTMFSEALSTIKIALDDQSKNSFLRADHEVQTKALSQLDEKAFTGLEELRGYRTLKQLILLGYFTSEQVMNQEMNYQSIPGKYDGCLSYEGNGHYVDNNVAGRL